MRVLIAPDHFGGTLTAAQTAAVLAAPWQDAGHQVHQVPMSDGATGMIEAVHASHGGSLIPVTVTGTAGTPVPSAVLHVPGAGGGSAYIEGRAVLHHTGDTAGATIRQQPGPATDVSTGSSAGVAELLRAALDTGARQVVVGLGPSPTHDAGTGLLRHLGTLAGVTPPDASGEPWHLVRPLREYLAGIDLVVASATDAPLLGLHGAGHGLQQFGLSAWDAQQVESRTSAYAHAALAHVRQLPPVRQVLAGPRQVPDPGAPHTGAGGGVAFALGLLGARILPGAWAVGAQTGLRRHLGECDLVLTGTRSLDVDALYEGVVEYVGTQAAQYGLPVVVLAQEVFVNRRELAKVGLSAAYPLVDQPLLPGNRRSTAVDPLQALQSRSARVLRNWARP